MVARKMCSGRMQTYSFSNLVIITNVSLLLFSKQWNKDCRYFYQRGRSLDIIDNGNSGYTVEKNNPISLASAIELLLKEPELCNLMGKAGQQLFEEKFTIEVFEKKMKECLEEMFDIYKV